MKKQRIDFIFSTLASQAQQQVNMNLFQLKYSYGKADSMVNESINSIESRFKQSSKHYRFFRKL